MLRVEVKLSVDKHYIIHNRIAGGAAAQGKRQFRSISAYHYLARIGKKGNQQVDDGIVELMSWTVISRGELRGLAMNL